MKVYCAFDKMLPLAELKPHPKNPNKHPVDQIARLAQILEYQGWRYPIKVSLLSGYITSGHGRLEAAKKMGLESVPVNFQEYESEAQEYADIVSDNSIAAWAQLDLSSINAHLVDLGEGFDLDMLGIKEFSIDVDFEPATEDEQGKLDETQVKIMECPKCHEHFEEKQAKVIN